MSLETANAPVEAVEAPTIDSDVQGDTEVAPELEEASGGESDPNESFEEWLARQEREEAAKSAPKDPKPKPAADKKGQDKEPEEKPVEKDPARPAKVKVGDKEYSVEEIQEQFKSYDQTVKQFEALQNQAKQLVEMLKSDPGAVLARVGANREAIEQWYYKNYIEPETLTPEQRETRELKEKLTKYEQEAARRAEAEKAAKEAQEAQRREAMKEQYRQEWSTKIQEALDSSGLPKSDWTVSRMAQYLKKAIAEGRKDVQPADVAKQVKEDWIQAQKALIAQLKPEELVAQLGEETLQKIRQHDVEKFKSKKFENNAPKDAKPREIKKASKRVTSVYDLLDDL